MSYDTDVMIIGAGPVGMTLANELVRHGASLMIVDKARGIREVSKAMILHVRTQEILDKVGIAEEVRAEAQPLTEVVVHAYGKHIGAWDLDGIDSSYKHPLIVGQNRTQHLLLDKLKQYQADVIWNTEATAVDVDVEGVTTTIKPTNGAEQQVRSRYVVGCEGSNSLVRKTLNFTFQGERYSGEQFIQADCRIRWPLPKGRSYLFLTTFGYMMVIEFPNDMVRIFISLPDKQTSDRASEAQSELGAVEAINEEPTLEEIRTHLTALSRFECELSDPVWLARYRTSHRYANKFSLERAFIAGDAGHVHVPIGGQGMNTGIQDAFNLGWKLAGVLKGALKPSVLQTYHEERHPVAESLIKGTNFAYTGILHPSEARQFAARLFGPFLIRNDRVQQFMRSTLEELRIVYPSSPLNLDLTVGVKGPKPGERVLDTVFVRASDKATVALNQLTRTTTWMLLLFGGTSAKADAAALANFYDEIAKQFVGRIATYIVIADTAIPAALVHQSDAVLFDQLRLAHERYEVSDASFYLLRPDTYIGARGLLKKKSELMKHLSSIFV